MPSSCTLMDVWLWPSVIFNLGGKNIMHITWCEECTTVYVWQQSAFIIQQYWCMYMADQAVLMLTKPGPTDLYLWAIPGWATLFKCEAHNYGWQPSYFLVVIITFQHRHWAQTDFSALQYSVVYTELLVQDLLFDSSVYCSIFQSTCTCIFIFTSILNKL